MTRKEIEKIINTFLIEEIEIDETLLKPEALLKEDLGIDSLDLVDIVVIIKHHFGLKINPEEMANVHTLSQFYDYVESKLTEL